MPQIPPSTNELVELLLFEKWGEEKVTIQHHTNEPMNLYNDPNNVYNIYLFGSRLYGTNRESSDYDFIAIVGGSYFNNSKLFVTQHLNVNCYHVDYVRYLMDVNVIWMVMLTSRDFPEDFVFRKTLPLHFDLENFDLNRLKTTVLMDASHNYAKAKRYCIQKEYRDPDICKKNIVHAVRHLRLALQLCRDRKISDYRCANDVWEELFVKESPEFKSWNDEWKYYDLKYKKLVDDLMAELKQFVYVQESQSIEFSNIIPYSDMIVTSVPEKSETLRFVERYGLNALKRDYSFHVTRPFSDSDLIVCVIDKITPRFTSKSIIGREFNAVVFKQNGDQYEVVAALPPPMIDQYPNTYEQMKTIYDELPLENLNFQLYTGGFDTLLFYDHESSSWRVYFPVITKRRFFRDLTLHLPGYERVSEDTCESDLVYLTEQFWQVWKSKQYQLPSELAYSYHFDFCPCTGKMNKFLKAQTVRRNSRDELVLMNVMEIGKTQGIMQYKNAQEIAVQHSWDVSVTIEALSPYQINNYVCNLDPMQFRGVIVSDKTGMNKVEFKNPQVDSLMQLQTAHLHRSTTNSNNMRELIRTSTGKCEVLFTEENWIHEHLSSTFALLKDQYDRLIERIKNDAAPLVDLFESDKRQFASKCKTLGHHSRIVFDMFNSNITPEAFLQTCHINVYKKVLLSLNQ